MRTFLGIRLSLAVTIILAGGIAGAQQGQAPAAKTAAPFPSIEVRYLSGDAINSYLTSRLPALAMQGRVLDPFGRFQDPNYRPPEPEVGGTDAGDAAPVHQATLSEIVSGIQVTLIKPGIRTFYVGGRDFHQGQTFPIKVSDTKTIKVEVVSVSSDGITFRDIEKNEFGVCRVGGAPAGVTRGTSIETPRGITVPNPSAPLDLQPSEVPPPNR